LKKVLIITYYWPPSGGAGVQRWLKFVKYLREFGVEPIVLTVDNDYASYPITDSSLFEEIPEGIKVFYTKSKEPFSIYKSLSGKKDIPHSGFANEIKVSLLQKIMRFIRGNLFIPDARKGWNKFAYKKAKQLILEHNITTIITTSPPHSTQLIGSKLKDDLKIKWVADLRDPWTDIYYYKQLYHTAFAKKIDSSYEKKVLTQADKIIVVSKIIKDQFLNKIPDIDNTKFSVIPNGFDELDFDDLGKYEKSNFMITYTGTISNEYHIESFLNAIKRLTKEINENQIILRFVGVVSDNYKNFIHDIGLSEITEYKGYVEHKKSVEYLQQSTVLFLAIPDVKNNGGILTGKLFEYLGAKKPIIGIGPVNGEAAMIIKECGAGKMFDYNDENNIYAYLLNLFQKWNSGENINIKNEQVKIYTRKHLTKELSSLMD
jgi:glycosyltransferase involved in cell wall biosynthesis